MSFQDETPCRRYIERRKAQLGIPPTRETIGYSQCLSSRDPCGGRLHIPSPQLHQLPLIYLLAPKINGLKQAPRTWFSRLSDALVTIDFCPSQADSSLFIYNQGIEFVYILVYVDYLLVISSTPGMSIAFVVALSNQFLVMYLATLHFLWGLKFSGRPSAFIFLNPSKSKAWSPEPTCSSPKKF
ncbi:hypothetical protein V2J09_003563 [Rumex salicifolius]